MVASRRPAQPPAGRPDDGPRRATPRNRRPDDSTMVRAVPIVLAAVFIVHASAARSASVISRAENSFAQATPLHRTIARLPAIFLQPI